MWRSAVRATRYQFLKLLRIRDTRYSICAGFACGMSAGALPPVAQTIIALCMAFMVGGNKIAAVVGVWWTNPVTSIPYYYFCYRLGLLVLAIPAITIGDFEARFASVEGWEALKSLGHDILMPLFWGTLVCAVILYPLSFYLLKTVLGRREERIKAKQLMKMNA